jgi:molecular chaperone HtpG
MFPAAFYFLLTALDASALGADIGQQSNGITRTSDSPTAMPDSVATASGVAETRAFQAEVARLLKLMVHSVYSEREVFLRELISNAADACDRLRYAAIAAPALLEGEGALRIVLKPDRAAKTLSVIDNGIGMSRDELIDNLGTIAKSGTEAFMREAAAGDSPPRLIGQFGIGFYSAFMVASAVEVISRKAGADEAWIWRSDGAGTFTVEPAPAEPKTRRGTEVRLHLRDDAEEFLDRARLEDIVRRYSDHIAHPIMIADEKAADSYAQINAASAIWMRPKAEVSPEEHKEFFGYVSGLYADPALTIHYRAEGRHEYTVLLYVPAVRPFDLYDPARNGRQRLYVRRVFITDDAALLPAWLRFVRGVVDCEDLPLNISREMLQHNPTVAAIRKALLKRVLSEFKKTATSDAAAWERIWEAFGAVIKEGLYEDPDKRDQIYDIARFRTTRGDNRSLADYASGMKPGQTAIYYITAEDARRAESSPQLEGFRARGVEVLLLTDPVDSFWVRSAIGFDGKPFKSITQGDDGLQALPLEAAPKAETSRAEGAALATLIALFKQALGGEVSDVRATARLTASPVCLVARDQGLDRTLERLLTRQNAAGVTATAPIFEINPEHPLIVALAAKAAQGGASDRIRQAAHLLLDQALILEGETPTDPARFAQVLVGLMQQALESQ